jgi:diguanylate cyclase (GGDEF)-like protein
MKDGGAASGLDGSSPLALYMGLTLLWLVLLFSALAAVAYYGWDGARREFERQVSRADQFVTDRTRLYEASLQEFANFAGAMPQIDFGRARQYVRELCARYPDIYMLELAERVKAKDRPALREAMRRLTGRPFAIHVFGYDGNRKVAPAPVRDTYYPVVFAEPERPGTSEVLGLDVASSASVLLDAMARSFALGSAVASHPFELLEGRRGYVLYRPISAAIGKRLIEDGLHQPWYALLVVDATTLLPAWISHTPGLLVTLYHRDFGPLDSAGRLTAATGPERSPLERALLPRFTRAVALPELSQPFDLAYSYQSGWHDLNPPLLGLLLVLCALAVVTTLWFGDAFHHLQLRILGEREQLFVVANFDTLTGLPNRNLLNDRLEHALQRTTRQDSRLGLLFLDLDHFKGVNDRFGHAAGDKVLCEVAIRLRRVLREEDTVGRLHGDEFLVVLEDGASDREIAQVRDKIHQAFVSPFTVNGETVRLAVSIGTAVFPRDGASRERLLHRADFRMFQEKRIGHGQLGRGSKHAEGADQAHDERRRQYD